VIYTRLLGAVESRWAPRASNPLKGINNVLGGFDPHPLPPFNASQVDQLVDLFIQSRREGLSPETIKWYRGYLNNASEVISIGISGQEINRFLNSLRCSNGGKRNYFGVLRTFYRWLYSPRSGYDLRPQDNPILMVESPKVEKRIMPALTSEQITYLVDQCARTRDKAIISLFSDSGLRLAELTSIRFLDIDWTNRLVKVRCKGNREGLAPFGLKTGNLLREWLTQYNPNGGNIWGAKNKWTISTMLKGLQAKTGLTCNPHVFRRSFATILAKSGVDSLHIMRLGRWESISMVERYTRSVKFEDSLRLYSPIMQ